MVHNVAEYFLFMCFGVVYYVNNPIFVRIRHKVVTVKRKLGNIILERFS